MKKTNNLTPELQKLKPKIVFILKKNGVLKAGIFGSYARGEQTRKSDIDILIKVKRKTGLFRFVGIKQELEQRLGKKVDLLTYESIHPYLKKGITKNEVRIL